MERTLNDYLEIKENLGSSKIKVNISFLEKLSNINYLNHINQKLNIKPFSKYPFFLLFLVLVEEVIYYQMTRE